jgi:mono/diheme cytochrome c family protein
MNRHVALLGLLLAASCTRSNMDSQPKYHEYEPGGLFRDGKVLQAPVPGTVARGDLDRASEKTQKPQLTTALLGRGRDQYDIYCSPCHDRVGNGDGIVVQRGMPRPASLHDDSQRAQTDQHLFDVISNGFGAMYAHGDRIRPRDRWAIVAYIRALQLSQHAALNDAPTDEQARLAIETKP